MIFFTIRTGAIRSRNKLSCINLNCSIYLTLGTYMSLKYIPVLAFEIDIDQVVEDLKNNDVVVLVTTRTHAMQIATKASEKLGIDEDDEDGPNLQHLSFEVDDKGWQDCLMYSESANYEPEELREITVHAIRDWISTGEKNYHICKMRAP